MPPLAVVLSLLGPLAATVAFARRAPAVAGACSPLPIPSGRCWDDGANRIASAPSATPAACCTRCTRETGCRVWVHWRPDGAEQLCNLYSAAAQTVPCNNGSRFRYAAGWSGPAPPPPPPYVPPFPTPAGAKDVIMIAIDDMRPELGAYGCQHMDTPFLDAFARDALVFDRAYCAVAWCSPSRTALLTSRRPDTSMTWSVVPSEYWRQRGGNFTTLPQYFRERGYLTVGMGKIFHPGAASGNDDARFSWSQESLPYDGTGDACPSSRPPRDAPPAPRVPASKGAAGKLSPAMEPTPQGPDDSLPACANATLRRIASQRASGADRRPFFLAVGTQRCRFGVATVRAVMRLAPRPRVLTAGLSPAPSARRLASTSRTFRGPSRSSGMTGTRWAASACPRTVPPRATSPQSP